MIHPILAQISDQFAFSTLLKSVSRQRHMVLAVFYRLLSALLSFVITFVVARTAGAAVTGAYAIAVSTLTMFAMAAVFGHDQIMLRNIAGDLAEGAPGKARAAFNAAARFVAIGSLIAASIVFLSAPFATWANADVTSIRLVGLALLFYPALRLSIAGIRAVGAVATSQFLDGVAHNALILLAIIFFVFMGWSITVVALSAFYAISLALVMLVVAIVFLRIVRGWGGAKGPAPLMLKASATVFMISGLSTLSSWMTMLLTGAYLDAESVGAYRVAVQVFTLVAMVTSTIEVIFNPFFAADFRKKDFRKVWVRHRQATIVMLGIGLWPGLACLIFPERILGLFGPEFQYAANALVILIVGQLINLATGPLGGMLIMSGRETFALKLAIASIAFTLPLAFVLIPMIGLEGAALVTSLPIIFRNLAAYMFMRQWWK